jgi:hypothetical protein
MTVFAPALLILVAGIIAAIFLVVVLVRRRGP